jgi:hypothetical protein
MTLTPQPSTKDTFRPFGTVVFLVAILCFLYILANDSRRISVTILNSGEHDTVTDISTIVGPDKVYAPILRQGESLEYTFNPGDKHYSALNASDVSILYFSKSLGQDVSISLIDCATCTQSVDFIVTLKGYGEYETTRILK